MLLAPLQEAESPTVRIGNAAARAEVRRSVGG
jgi:hypothetical protein